MMDRFRSSAKDPFADIQRNLRGVEEKVGILSRRSSKGSTGYYRAASTGIGLPLTQVAQDVPGTSLTIKEVGTYLVFGIFDFTTTVAGSTNAIGELVVGGVTQTQQAIKGDTVERITTPQVWVITISNRNTIVKLTARKFSAGGTVTCQATHTTITAIKLT